MANVRIGVEMVLEDKSGRQLRVVMTVERDGRVIMDDGRRFVKASYGKLRRDVAAGKYKVVNTGGW